MVLADVEEKKYASSRSKENKINIKKDFLYVIKKKVFYFFYIFSLYVFYVFYVSLSNSWNPGTKNNRFLTQCGGFFENFTFLFDPPTVPRLRRQNFSFLPVLLLVQTKQSESKIIIRIIIARRRTINKIKINEWIISVL